MRILNESPPCFVDILLAMGPITLRSDYASNMLTSLLVVMRPLPVVTVLSAPRLKKGVPKQRYLCGQGSLVSGFWGSFPATLFVLWLKRVQG